MKKDKIILSFAGLLAAIFICSVFYVILKPEPLLIQGEVDMQEVNVSSKIPGRITKIYVQRADKVTKGTLLASLDTPEIQAKVMQSDAALEAALAMKQKVYTGARTEQKNMAYATLKQAQAQKELAQKTYTRMVNLHNDGVVASQKLDEVKAQYLSASRALDSAKNAYQLYASGERSEDKYAASANVAKAKGALYEASSYLKENKIFAPVQGEITEISAEEGELTGAGYPIITIANPDDVWVTFNLREDMLTKIKTGTIINAKFPALGNKIIPLEVKYISVLGSYANWRATKAKGDFDMKTFEVRAYPLEKNNDLRAGMSAIADYNKIKAE